MTTLPASQFDTEELIRIRGQTDIVFAQHRAKLWAKKIGFTKKGQWQIAIAISEAASNILKFANHGTILIKELIGSRKGLEFIAADEGPGIPEIEKALEDGFSEGRKLGEEIMLYHRRGLGSGIPAIKRMMDRLIITSNGDGGTILMAKKYLS